MKLGEAITWVDENKFCRVLATDNAQELARYDGRNSIPEELNGLTVEAVSYGEDGYLITVRR